MDIEDVALLRVDEVADLLRLSKTNTYKLMRRGKLPFVKIGKSRRVPVQGLRDMIAQLVEDSTGK